MMTRSLGVSALLVFGATVAAAGTITVVNPSFEDPALLKGASTVDAIPGWATGNFGAAGVFHPGVAQFPGGAPNGMNTAFSNGDVISQALGETLQAGVVYTLMVDVGARLDTSYFGGAIELAAGGATLRTVPADSVPLGGFATITLTFNALPSHPSVGQQLEVRLIGYGLQTNFDNVRLETQPFVPTIRLVPSQHATIQGAIDASLDGDEVVVSPGTYTELLDMHGKLIRLRSSDGPAATILDAAGAGPGLFMGSGETRDTVVEGFTFRNALSGGGGGAMQLSFASPTIRDCVFSDNEGVDGGAIGGSGAPRIEGCAFRSNTAGQEGGAISLSADLGQGSIEVIDCSFLDNSARGALAGAALLSAVNVVVRGCDFTNNSADTSGAAGALFVFALDALVQGCRFSGNQAGFGGAIAWGALFFAGDRAAPGFLGARDVGPTGPPLTVRLGIDTCEFESNSASLGGAVALFADPTISFFPLILDGSVRNCAFAANRAELGPPTGAGASGGAIAFVEELSAPAGGGLFLPSRLVIGESTFAQNTAAGAGGGVWHAGESPVRLVGCILWGNADASGAGEFSQYFVGPADTATRSCIQGYAAIAGSGNIASDPMFVDELGPDSTPGTGDEDFRLASLSPCVDAGDAEGVLSTTATDVLGLARVVDDPASPNVGVPVAGFGWIDMGAFERQVAPVAPCLGDENEDGVVDFFDLNNVLGGFGAPCVPGPAR